MKSGWYWYRGTGDWRTYYVNEDGIVLPNPDWHAGASVEEFEARGEFGPRIYEPPPGWLPLTPKERARCDHPQRIMSGNGSICSACFVEAFDKGIRKYREELIEKLAELAHEQWSDIKRSTLNRLATLTEPGFVGSKKDARDAIDRWRRQIATPYAELSEEEKESDRVEARKVLALLEEYAPRPPSHSTKNTATTVPDKSTCEDCGRSYTGIFCANCDPEWEPVLIGQPDRERAQAVVQGLLEIAETALPDTYFATDSRVAAAREWLRGIK